MLQKYVPIIIKSKIVEKAKVYHSNFMRLNYMKNQKKLKTLWISNFVAEITQVINVMLNYFFEGFTRLNEIRLI